MFPITPLFFWIISRATRCRQKNTPLPLTRMMRSQSASVRSMMSARRVTPALFTRTSTWPNVSTTRWTIWSVAPRSPMSVSIATLFLANAAAAPAVACAATASMSTAATSAPARASASAVALPMPWPAPVTIATRPFSMALHLAPVPALLREHGLAADRLRGAVEGVGRRAPHRVVRRRAVRLERGLVLVHLVEVVDVLVLRVLQHVEPQTAGLVLLRAERVDLDGLQELVPHLRLDARLHPDRQHGRVSFRVARGRWLAGASRPRSVHTTRGGAR